MAVRIKGERKRRPNDDKRVIIITLQRTHDTGYQHRQGDDFHSPVLLSLFERHPERVGNVLQVEKELYAIPIRHFALLVRFGFDPPGVADAQMGHPDADRAQYQRYGVHAGESEFTV